MTQEVIDALKRLKADEYGFHNEHDYSRPVGLQELDDLRIAKDELVRLAEEQNLLGDRHGI